MVRLTDSPTTIYQFPHLDLTIKVRCDDAGVRSVSVVDRGRFFAGEFVAENWLHATESGLPDDQLSVKRHAIANRMHVASLALDILRGDSDYRDRIEVEQTLDMAIKSLEELDHLAMQRL